ncbi:hypothetical protein HYW74_03410 [Candidatus Pacearchaeota archaeon]|nr:hypothetical protein [Candidatus Pacearchaeota archaeon]
MIDESKLEIEAKKQPRPSIKRTIVNYLRGLFGYSPLNDNVSSDNHVVNSFIYGVDDVPESRVSPDNILVGSLIYDSKRNGFY